MQNKNILIMAHLVVGFPNKNGCLEAMRALKDSNVDILELQVPFSDPTADGPVITHANEAALQNGFNVKEIFEYIKEAQQIGFKRIVVMTYANIAFAYGIKKYVDDMKQAVVEGLIIPDLPIEDEEGFYAYAFEKKITPIPVIVPNMLTERIKLLKKKPFTKLYVSLRTGTTGSATQIDAPLIKFLGQFKQYELFGGFGIESKEQIEMLSPYVDVAVVGSYITKTIKDAYVQRLSVYDSVKRAVEILH